MSKVTSKKKKRPKPIHYISIKITENGFIVTKEDDDYGRDDEKIILSVKELLTDIGQAILTNKTKYGRKAKTSAS